MNLIKGIHHAALKCADLEKFHETVRFYRDVLGLPVLRRWGNEEKAGIMFDTGDGLIEIFASGSASCTTGSVTLLWQQMIPMPASPLYVKQVIPLLWSLKISLSLPSRPFQPASPLLSVPAVKKSNFSRKNNLLYIRTCNRRACYILTGPSSILHPMLYME